MHDIIAASSSGQLYAVHAATVSEVGGREDGMPSTPTLTGPVFPSGRFDPPPETPMRDNLVGPTHPQPCISLAASSDAPISRRQNGGRSSPRE